jgi:ferredoxin
VKWHLISLLAVVILASAAACLSDAANPVNPSGLTANVLTVDEGFTAGAVDPVWGYMRGEFSAFTVRWTPVQDAAFYEIRASEQEITEENWNSAIPMAVVQAPADSADVSVKVEVQTEPCIGCGLCEQICPMSAITVQGGVAVIDYDLCTSCGQCQDVCPMSAITGTRYAVDYFFGIRAFLSDDAPASDISVSENAYRLIYYNNHYSFFPSNSCGLCIQSEDSLGCFGGCYVINDYKDPERLISTGPGCPVDAVWQDTVGAGPVPNMVYIDYNLCTSCGQCLLECWNYQQRINPDPMSYIGLRSFKRMVVPAGWVSNQPARP